MVKGDTDAQGRVARGLRCDGAIILVLAIVALLAPTAGAQAALPGPFDDWSPSGRKEPLPTAPGPVEGSNQVPPKAKLGYATILGVWCAPSSTYRIARTRLTVYLKSGREVVFPITVIRFTARTVKLRWTSRGEPRTTVFAKFSADRRTMVQIGVNRTYRRCIGPAAGAKLGYSTILGSWCGTGPRYIITRTRLTVVRGNDRRTQYRIDRFEFSPSQVVMRWRALDGSARRTAFGRFSADRRRMVQIAVGRAYRRC